MCVASTGEALMKVDTVTVWWLWSSPAGAGAPSSNHLDGSSGLGACPISGAHYRDGQLNSLWIYLYIY